MDTQSAMSLGGLRTVVTGASSGIGAAIARDLAAAGARVLVNYHSNETAGQAVVKEIEAKGGEALAVAGDVSRESDVGRLFERANAAFGGVDLLVNNAGIQQDAALVDMTLAQWQRVIEVNLTGQFLCARAAVREFLRPDHKPGACRCLGNIICISSVHETIPWAGRINYAASKGGVAMMMQSMALELAVHRIRVNAVAPGAIKTSINREEWETEEARGRLLEMIPYGRIGDVEDIAQAVRWLACDASDYVTGTTLVVDGGMTLYPSFRSGG